MTGRRALALVFGALVLVFVLGSAVTINVRPLLPSRGITNIQHRSSGLGLLIVAAIVEAHGGTIEVDTEIGTGSTLTLTLPGVPS